MGKLVSSLLSLINSSTISRGGHTQTFVPTLVDLLIRYIYHLIILYLFLLSMIFMSLRVTESLAAAKLLLCMTIYFLGNFHN